MDNGQRVSFLWGFSEDVVGRTSAVGIATGYRLVGSVIKSRWGRDFPCLSRPALGPIQPPVQREPFLFSGLKRLGRGIDHPSLSSAEVKERVELYNYCPFRSSWYILASWVRLDDRND